MADYLNCMSVRLIDEIDMEITRDWLSRLSEMIPVRGTLDYRCALDSRKIALAFGVISDNELGSPRSDARRALEVRSEHPKVTPEKSTAPYLASTTRWTGSVTPSTLRPGRISTARVDA